jgi:long-chain fatty acid transport protein
MKTFKILAVVVALAAASTSFALNGIELIGIGTNSEAMGGTGIANPQELITAISTNPAGMSFMPGAAYSELNFDSSLLTPNADGDIANPAGQFHADSHRAFYAIPAIGISIPLDPEKRWHFGFGAYGVCGIGVDYRNTSLDQPKFFDFGPLGKFPLIAGQYSSLYILKFSPAVSYEISPQLSVGAALHIDFSTLDLGSGSTVAYSAGAQFGVVYKPMPVLSLGLMCVTPQPSVYRHIADFNGDGNLDKLTLEQPTIVGLGISYSALEDRLLLSVDGKWLNWSNADGFSDYDWEDQWVVALGAQYAVIPKKLFVRIGYNFGNSPVVTHNGWNGSLATPNPDLVDVQGKMVPRYYFETFRTIGTPALLENHFTVGAGYALTERIEVNVAYSHAFENGITEHGTNIGGQPTTIRTSISNDVVDFGITWRF